MVIWERRERLPDDDTPSQEADAIPIDHDYALAPDPIVVNLALEANASLREEILQLRKLLEITMKAAVWYPMFCWLRQGHLLFHKVRFQGTDMDIN